jgi:MFS family permease
MEKIYTAFPVFRIKDYRLYFFGQLISLVGTWLQMVADSLLVLHLTNSAFWLGVVTAVGLLPVLLFSLFGGVIVDRFHTRHLLIFTNIAAMTLAFILGILVITNLISVPIILVLAFLLGIVNALDMPARQSFTVEIVGREYLPSAIALNMGMFNSSRVIGPAIAGFLIQQFSIGPAYIFNGLSFIAAIIALLIMKVQSDIPEHQAHPIQAIKDGLTYTKNHQLIRTIIVFMTFFSIFGFSYGTLLPIIAEHIFHQNASGLGIMYAASGIGALIGTFIVYPLTKKFNELQLIAGGTFTFLVALVLFSITTNYTLALVLLGIQGVAMAFPWAMLMSSVQKHVDNAVRGRVSSIATLAMLGMQPIGAFQMGFLADRFGPPFALQFGSFIVFLATIYLVFSLKKPEV